MNEELLVEKIIESAMNKGKAYEMWQKGVRNHADFCEPSYMASAREYLSEHEYDYTNELIELRYLVPTDGFWTTFSLGENKNNQFLSSFAYTFTVEQGYITEEENDYYEVGYRQYEIAKEYLENKKKNQN